MSERVSHFDVVVVGAGFAGLYALHKLRGAGYAVRVLEAASDIGGTWYWNQYPGARCDVESMQYSFSFSEEIQREWNWTEHYAAQPEILRYINFVADRLNLRGDIQLDTAVTSAIYDESGGCWNLLTQNGERFSARYCIMATGCLSVPVDPYIAGLSDFGGEIFRTSSWPHDSVELRGRRVGLLGTGSSGIQVAPIIAEQAERLFIFQRTPNYSLPARNRPMEPEYEKGWKENYPGRRTAALSTRNYTLNNAGQTAGATLSEQDRERELEARWSAGGVGFMYAFPDLTSSKEVNSHASEFVRRKIKSIVKDPAIAEKLAPTGYGIGGKRVCVDTGYFEVFNRDNVTLVDLNADPIEAVTNNGVRTRAGEVPLDTIVLATGFDAMTGALNRIEIKGRNGVSLREKWESGATTYLGLMISGFPNLFTINGPGSVSVLANMVTAIEQHVDWIAECLSQLRRQGRSVIEAKPDAELNWMKHVNEIAAPTLLANSRSWYNGANIPGKPRCILVYLGGGAKYREVLQQVVDEQYAGFAFS